jgi:hypothetical protein
MRAFARKPGKKPKAIRPTTSADSTQPGQTHFSQRSEVNSNTHRQRDAQAPVAGPVRIPLPTIQRQPSDKPNQAPESAQNATPMAGPANASIDDMDVAKKQCKPWTHAYISNKVDGPPRCGDGARAKIVAYSERCVANRASCRNKAALLANINQHGNQACQQFCKDQNSAPGFFSAPNKCSSGGCERDECPRKCPMLNSCLTNYNQKGAMKWNCHCRTLPCV